MKQKTSLLTALRNYRPRENHDPLENFITEAFAWLLINHPKFGRFYLGRILSLLGLGELPTGHSIKWETQVNLGGVYPDLVGEVGAHAYLFEHKAWSPLHASQLDNYRAGAVQKYGKANYHLILITGGISQIDQNPNLGLCWHEVHAWITDWQQHKEYEPDHLFVDFQHLLKSEGLGPPAPVSHEAILAYQPARSFEPALSSLIIRVSGYPWEKLLLPASTKSHLPWHHSLWRGKDRWGRFGINLLGDTENWSPGLFAGFLVNPTDHNVEWLNPACPDFSLILDINIEKHPNYEQTETYNQLRSAMEAKIKEACPDYQFFDHLANSPAPNKWHPIHIRKPMLEMLRGTRDGNEQEKRFIDETTRLLRCVTSCPEYRAFRDSLHTEKKTELPL